VGNARDEHNNNADTNQGVETESNDGTNQGVDTENNDNQPGSDDDGDATNDMAQLDQFVTGLEAELDAEIAQLDSDYNPDDAVDDIETDDDKLDDRYEDENFETHREATREQAIADQEDDEDDDNEPSNVPNEGTPSRLRKNWQPSYGHLKGRDGDGSLPTVARPEEFGGGKHQSHVILQSIIMTQYNLKQGIKKFGTKGKDAVVAELRQLHNRDVMEPVDKYDLIAEERRGALRYLMFLKEKRCGKIKGRGCADGRPQRDYMTEEDTSSPTVATEALILTCLVDAIEGRDVATCDIPGAFMQSKMEGKVVMKLEGVMADMILKINPLKYEKYTKYERGQPVVYVILTKAL
jgi:hypothetical protein